MSRFQTAVLAFWVLAIGILIYQWYSMPAYVKPAAIHRNTEKRPYEPPPKVVRANLVIEEQMIQNETPDQYHFRFPIVVKNLGELDAKNVSIHVKPFRYGYVYPSDEDLVKSTDPLYEFGDFFHFPLIKAGETKTGYLDFRIEKAYTPRAIINPDQVKYEEVNPAAPSTNSPFVAPAAAR